MVASLETDHRLREMLEPRPQLLATLSLILTSKPPSYHLLVHLQRLKGHPDSLKSTCSLPLSFSLSLFLFLLPPLSFSLFLSLIFSLSLPSSQSSVDHPSCHTLSVAGGGVGHCFEVLEAEVTSPCPFTTGRQPTPQHNPPVTAELAQAMAANDCRGPH